MLQRAKNSKENIMTVHATNSLNSAYERKEVLWLPFPHFNSPRTRNVSSCLFEVTDTRARGGVIGIVLNTPNRQCGRVIDNAVCTSIQ